MSDISKVNLKGVKGRLTKDVTHRDARGLILIYVEGTEFEIQDINTQNLSINTSIGVVYQSEFSIIP